MRAKAAIVGVSQSKCGERTDVNQQELIYETVTKALEEASLDITDIDALVMGSMPAPMEGIMSPQLFWGDAAGPNMKPVTRVATCGTTGISTAQEAYYQVASGLFDVVLAVGFEKMYENDSPQAVMSTIWDYRYQYPFLAGAPGVFALQAMEYVYRYGLRGEDVREAAAMISARAHNDALDNPYAHIRKKVSVEDVLRSRIVCYPIRLLDSCPVSDGACVVIFASPRAARKITDSPAWVRGLSYRGDEQYVGDKDLVWWLSAYQAAHEAYRQADITEPSKQIDIAELYVPFSFLELTFLETFGFCGRGQAVKEVREGRFSREQGIPIAPSGGVLCTNPIGATALQRVGEAALQVMGLAGQHQVPDAETAVAHGIGGCYQFNGVMVLSQSRG